MNNIIFNKIYKSAKNLREQEISDAKTGNRSFYIIQHANDPKVLKEDGEFGWDDKDTKIFYNKDEAFKQAIEYSNYGFVIKVVEYTKVLNRWNSEITEIRNDNGKIQYNKVDESKLNRMPSFLREKMLTGEGDKRFQTVKDFLKDVGVEIDEDIAKDFLKYAKSLDWVTIKDFNTRKNKSLLKDVWKEFNRKYNK